MFKALNSLFKKIIYKIMNPIDSLLKPLKIDLGSFFSYVFAIGTILLTFDRVVELGCVLFTGQFTNYWSPLMYTFALFVVVAGYAILCGSPFRKTILQPVDFYLYYSIAFRIICGVMIAQWVNQISWILLMCCSNFKFIAVNMPELIHPAITSLTLLFPLFLLRVSASYYINDYMDADQDWIDSFEDYKGFKLVADKNTKKIPSVYMCNAQICIDDKPGQPAIIPEKK